MKVILLENIKGVGLKDQIVEVSSGYAINFLLPKNKAVLADNRNLSNLKGKIDKQKHEEKLKLEAAQKLKTELDGICLNIKQKVGENNKLFGTLTEKIIVEELKKQKNIEIDKKKIVIKEAIKFAGKHTIKVKLHTDVVANLDILIQAN